MTSFWLVDSALGLLVVSSTCVQKEKGKGKSMAGYYILSLPKEMCSFDIIQFLVTLVSSFGFEELVPITLANFAGEVGEQFLDQLSGYSSGIKFKKKNPNTMNSKEFSWVFNYFVFCASSSFRQNSCKFPLQTKTRDQT